MTHGFDAQVTHEGSEQVESGEGGGGGGVGGGGESGEGGGLGGFSCYPDCSEGDKSVRS